MYFHLQTNPDSSSCRNFPHLPSCNCFIYEYSYGAYSYGAYSYGAYSYGAYSYGAYSYGAYSYGAYLVQGPRIRFLSADMTI
jgi:hypothetical protein